MNNYLLLMRGDQTAFEHMREEDRKAMIQTHIDYSRHLEAQGVLVEGDGFAGRSLLLSRPEASGDIQVVDSPYSATKEQLSGFYIIKAESEEAAIAIAKACPALLHGETVEVLALGH